MVEVMNNLGRSLVIDLKADKSDNFRQIDHRTIESIVFKNVLYVLKKGGKSFDDVDTRIPDGVSKWDANQLAVGDIFSGTSYYETVMEVEPSEVLCYEKNFNDRPVTIDRNILATTMNNASVFDEEEKISKTNLATKLVEADNKAFQVCFKTQASEKGAVEALSGLSRAPNAAEAKDLAKKCLSGREVTMTCSLSKAEGKLGRSTVVELSTNGYKQVDHRSIKWIVIDNIKYTLK